MKQSTNSKALAYLPFRKLLQKVFFTLLVAISLHFFTRWQTDGFRMSKATMQHPYPFHEASLGTPRGLNQPFHYMSKGVQFYVFLGEDNQTILKLFKHHHFGLSLDTIKTLLPGRLASRHIQKREKRMRHLFQSAHIAGTLLSEETGVYYTHLSKTDQELGKGHIIDKIGVKHPIDFDKVEFLLQKRGETVKSRLESLFQSGDVNGAICAIKNIQHLVEHCSLQGIKNKDGNVLENCGFIGQKAVRLDIGSLTYRSKSTNPDPHSKAVMRCTLELLGWVKKHYPQHLKQCKHELYYEKTL